MATICNTKRLYVSTAVFKVFAHAAFGHNFYLFDLDRERHVLPCGCLVGSIACCLDFDLDFVGAFLQAFLHGHLAGLLVDLEEFLEALLSLLGRNELVSLLAAGLFLPKNTTPHSSALFSSAILISLEEVLWMKSVFR